VWSNVFSFPYKANMDGRELPCAAPLWMLGDWECGGADGWEGMQQSVGLAASVHCT